MQISSGQDGIQRLLAAEQEAQKIVTAARKGGPALIYRAAAICPTCIVQARVFILSRMCSLLCTSVRDTCL